MWCGVGDKGVGDKGVLDEGAVRRGAAEDGAISFFQRYLTVWVLLCMVAGVLLGHFVPAVPEFLGRLQVAGISIPIAVLIWVMIYPMMIKVDFQSIRNVGKNPRGLVVTWVTNWAIKPFTMYAIAYLFLFVVFGRLISPDLATQYLAGAVLLGAAPCTAMVFVWSSLTHGNPAYTVVQVATNDLIILVLFVPIVKFLLGVSNVTVPYATLFVSIFLFVVIPLVGGVLTRVGVTRSKGAAYLDEVFVHKFDNATTAGLLATLVIIFSSQAEVILGNPLHIVLIAVPLVIQTFYDLLRRLWSGEAGATPLRRRRARGHDRRLQLLRARGRRRDRALRHDEPGGACHHGGRAHGGSRDADPCQDRQPDEGLVRAGVRLAARSC